MKLPKRGNTVVGCHFRVEAPQTYLSLGVCMLRMRQGLLADTAALASDLKASFTTLIPCTCNRVLSHVSKD